MKIWCLVPVFNGADLLKRCLASIAEQDDPDFAVVVCDDGSTEQAVKAMAEGYQDRDGWTWLRHRHNVGSTQNIVASIHTLETTQDIAMTDVFLLVDGDDRLAHSGVLTRLREVYADPSILVSWGSYAAEPPDDGCPSARPLPPDILRYGMVRAFTRDYSWWPNHPYSFRRRAFDLLDEGDWTFPDGEPHRHAYDVTLMTPMIEGAGERVAFVDEPLYVYRSDCDDATHRIHAEAIAAENRDVTSRPRRYQPLPDDWYVPEPDPEGEVETEA